MGTPSGAGNQMKAQQLKEVENRARHINTDGKCIDMHLERLTKVDQRDQKSFQRTKTNNEIKEQHLEGDRCFS